LPCHIEISFPMPYVFFLLICGFWSGSFILMKKAALCFSPVGIGAGRVIGGAAVLGIIWWHRSQRWSFERQDIGPLVLVVLCGFVWPFSIQPWLVARHGSAFIGMTVSFTPLLTMAVSIPLLGIYPTARQVAGVCGALVFLGVLMWDGLERQIPAAELACAMTVPLSYALTNTVIRRCLSRVRTLELTFVSLLAASSVLIPLAFVGRAETTSGGEDFTVQAIAALAVLGIFGTGVATLMFNRLIVEQGPLFAGMVTNLVPVGAVLWGWGDHEQITVRQIVALLGLVAMVTFVQAGAARRPVA
jgi:drug/metabolite transporter (DMT)-like permease